MDFLEHYSSSEDEEKEMVFLQNESGYQSTTKSLLEDGDQNNQDLKMDLFLNTKNKKTNIWEGSYITPVIMSIAIVIIVIIIIAIIIIFLAIALTLQLFHNGTKKTVLLIGIDGFRWDYIDIAIQKNIAPNILKLMNEGIRINKLKPVFPSKTFPNHYSIVTGLYAESHGIISNDFYDPELQKQFKVGDSSSYDPDFWKQAEPVWITLKKKNIDSATVFWPGSDVEINGERPTYWIKFDSSMTINKRVEKFTEFVDVIGKPQFFALYFEHVDTAGHKYGPNTTQTDEALTLIDNSIGDIINILKSRNLLESTDIIITGDHGMTEIYNDKYINLNQYINYDTDAKVYSFGPVSDLYLVPGANIDTIFDKVKNIPHVTAYKKNDIPDKFKYRKSHRVPEIVLVADLGYTIAMNDQIWTDHGNHGYDPDISDMRAGFIASGPSFLQNEIIAEVDNIHIYSLICHLLGLKKEDMAPNNGTISSIEQILKPEFRSS